MPNLANVFETAKAYEACKDCLEAKDRFYFPKFFLKQRGDGYLTIGHGSSDETGLSFGGQAFHSQACCDIWAGFPNSFFFNPKQLHFFPWVAAQSPFTLPNLLSYNHKPHLTEWINLVEDAKKQIKNQKFKKVVLARQTSLTFGHVIDPLTIWKVLSPMGNQTSLFLFQIDDQTTWMGATPENLFRRKELKLFTEAVGGTKLIQDQWTQKEKDEFQFIYDFLDIKLRSCCENIQWSSLHEKNFGKIVHLYQKAEATLTPTMTDRKLVELLHPTPALGGYPQKEALEYIIQNEPFSRGWYGSPIGFFSQKESHVSVGIRSVLIRKNEIFLFVGAGIVEESDALKEWEELDNKIYHITKYLF